MYNKTETKKTETKQMRHRVHTFFDYVDSDGCAVVAFCRGDVVRKYWPSESSRWTYLRLLIEDGLRQPQCYVRSWEDPGGTLIAGYSVKR